MAEEKDNGKEKPEQTKERKEFSLNDLISDIFKAYGDSGSEPEKSSVRKMIGEYLTKSASKHSVSEKYNIVVLYDSSTMVKSDADSIYRAVTTFSEEKPLLLILYSNGGSVGSAYLIGQLCREYCTGKFVISIPRQAKSAATLLCCASDEIHMGSLSELGPIDPQIDNLPALGLKNSIQHIANLVKETPEAAEMFARYLQYSVKPIDLGYYERVAESAMQYAEKLLDFNAQNLPRQAKEIARELVYSYKDHGFVIDKSEAIKVFGDNLVKINTDEYELGNSLYSEISMIESIFGYLDYSFYLIGCLDSSPTIRKKR